MDQVKQGSKTLLDLFQASSTKKCRPNKGLDSPTPGPRTNDQSYATLSSKIGKSHYSAATKNCWTIVPCQNHLSDQNNRENEV